MPVQLYGNFSRSLRTPGGRGRYNVAMTDKPILPGDPEASLAPLPVDRAFVIQLRAQSHGADPFIGRVEHIASGAAARFECLDDLATFVLSVLAHDPAGGSESQPPGHLSHARKV